MSVRPILYYALFSPPSRSALLTSKLIGLDLELKKINFLKQEHHSDWYLKINPCHTVPVLVDQGVPLCESNAIITYMVNQYGRSEHDHLYPKDFIKRAKVDERLYFCNGVLAPAMKDFIMRIIRGDEIAYNRRSIDASHNAYSFLEEFLAHSNYVAGDNLSLADISINTVLITLQKIVTVEEERYPKINAWMQRIQEELLEHQELNEKGAQQLYSLLQSALEDNMTKRA